MSISGFTEAAQGPVLHDQSPTDLNTSISSIPAELIQHTFSFLELDDLSRASLVCRAWKALAYLQGKKTNPDYSEVIPFLAKNFDHAIGRKCAEILNPFSLNMFSPINLEDDLRDLELNDLNKLVHLAKHADWPEELASIEKTTAALNYLVMLGNNTYESLGNFASNNPFEQICFESIIHLAKQRQLDHLVNAINKHDNHSFKEMLSLEIFITLIINDYASNAKKFLSQLTLENGTDRGRCLAAALEFSMWILISMNRLDPSLMKRLDLFLQLIELSPEHKEAMRNGFINIVASADLHGILEVDAEYNPVTAREILKWRNFQVEPLSLEVTEELFNTLRPFDDMIKARLKT